MYEKEYYLITEEILKANTNNADEYNFCKKWVDEHNTFLESFDFSEPRRLVMVACFNGLIISYIKINKWLPEDTESANTALLTYMESHEDELIEFYKFDDTHTIHDNPYKELENILLSDKNFRLCTNVTSRHAYFRDFIKKEKNKKFLLLFRSARDIREKEYRLADLFDKIYNDYRNKCYKTKTLLGEPLPKD